MYNNKKVGSKNISDSLSRVVNICKGFLESSFAMIIPDTYNTYMNIYVLDVVDI